MNCHKVGECGPPEEHIVCHFKIGYLKLYVLSAEVLPSPKGHRNSDLAGGGRYCFGDCSVEGRPTWM
jgi:hypothetical protein